MELKRYSAKLPFPVFFLLIVPYGIETVVLHIRLHLSFLLIVPYGIETAKGRRKHYSECLLIVPYGIETLYSHWLECLSRPFNRTLWN